MLDRPFLPCLISPNKRASTSSYSELIPPEAKRHKQQSSSPNSNSGESPSPSPSSPVPSNETVKTVDEYRRVYETFLAVHESIKLIQTQSLEQSKGSSSHGPFNNSTKQSSHNVGELIDKAVKFSDLKLLAAANSVSKRSTSLSDNEPHSQAIYKSPQKPYNRIPLLSKRELGLRLYGMIDRLIEPDRYAAEKLRIRTPVYSLVQQEKASQPIIPPNSQQFNPSNSPQASQLIHQMNTEPVNPSLVALNQLVTLSNQRTMQSNTSATSPSTDQSINRSTESLPTVLSFAAGQSSGHRSKQSTSESNQLVNENNTFPNLSIVVTPVAPVSEITQSPSNNLEQ